MHELLTHDTCFSYLNQMHDISEQDTNTHLAWSHITPQTIVQIIFSAHIPTPRRTFINWPNLIYVFRSVILLGDQFGNYSKRSRKMCVARFSCFWCPQVAKTSAGNHKALPKPKSYLILCGYLPLKEIIVHLGWLTQCICCDSQKEKQKTLNCGCVFLFLFSDVFGEARYPE